MAFDDEEIPVRLLVELCLVLLRLEEDDAFAVLNREPDFAAIVMEHEDTVAEALERMKIVREMVEEAAAEDLGPS